jgi:hypothetical protein
MTEPPIACTLDARQASARKATIERLWDDALVELEPTEKGWRARLHGTQGIERRVRELIVAESRCCAFLAFTFTREGEQLVLDISGPAQARPVIEDFFARAAA